MAEHHKNIVRRSHHRSEKFGIRKEQVISNKILSNSDLKENLENNQELVSVARPFINDLYHSLQDSGFIIILTDKEGCILHLIGDGQTKKAAKEQNMIPGAFMDESHIGTNAMGIALKENTSIQITAQEHFISAYYKWTCSAAPIHDSEQSIIGVLNITGFKEKVHPHTLGLVVASVRAIENKLIGNQMQEQLYQAQYYAFAMMNNLSYGVFAIGFDDSIQWVNDTACRTLNIRRSNLINKTITQIFEDWKRVKEILQKGNTYHDETHQFNIKGINEKYLFNGLLIKAKNGETLGFLLTFRSYRRVMNLVNKFTGMRATYTFDNIIGASKLWQETVEYARSVAKSPSTILITGESGTGKEVFAQSIHAASNRGESGFLAINCGAISPALIESELFGYEEGAFTGAKKGGKPGKFEYADGGTLFLDEIGEMPYDMQIRLLRALQENAISRVGSNKVVPVDVRIIAATNKNLKKEVDEGRFRLDLYYRLNVIQIEIPPLRMRRDDIPLLVNEFLKQKADKLQKPIPALAKNVHEDMYNYEWPGNIRELENFIEKAVILDGNISFQSQEIYENQKITTDTGGSDDSTQDTDEIISIAEAEKRAIMKALEKYNGNISRASRALEIGRNTLYQKIKRYGIEVS